MRIIFLVLFFVINHAPAQVFLIQRGTEAIVHKDVNLAFLDLEEGDELYMPGGTFLLTQTFFGPPCSNGGLSPVGTLPNNVKIFGAGHYPDYTTVTGKTILQQFIQGNCNGQPKEGILELGRSNILTGVVVEFQLWLGNNSSVSYSHLAFVNVRNGSTVSGAHVAKNIINNELSSVSAFGSAGLISQNIIMGRVFGSGLGTVFDSNIFLDTTDYTFPPSNCGNCNFHLIEGSNATIQNNIFVTQHTNGRSLNHNDGLTYTNNLFVGPKISGNVLPGTWAYRFNTQNTFSQDPNTLFENYIWGDPFDYGFDFHLPPGHIGIGADTHGENIGIFKTNDPSENKIPFNPHFISKMIPAESDVNGKLLIQIQAEARQN